MRVPATNPVSGCSGWYPNKAELLDRQRAEPKQTSSLPIHSKYQLSAPLRWPQTFWMCVPPVPLPPAHLQTALYVGSSQ